MATFLTEEMMRQLGVIGTATLFLALVGCGDGMTRVPVQGKISAKGKALDGASIQFIPVGGTKGEGGLGRSDSSGSFTMIGSRAGASGVVPGKYKVRVSRLIARDGTPLSQDAKQADNPGSKESVPGPYNSLDGSPLEVTVTDTGWTGTLEIPVAVLGQK
jgi:hypothetical protein